VVEDSAICLHLASDKLDFMSSQLAVMATPRGVSLLSSDSVLLLFVIVEAAALVIGIIIWRIMEKRKGKGIRRRVN